MQQSGIGNQDSGLVQDGGTRVRETRRGPSAFAKVTADCRSSPPASGGWLWSAVSILAIALIAATSFAQQSGAPAERLGPNDPFTVAINMTTIESAPVFVARERAGANGFRIINGGVRNVAAGTAHAGTNAETQMLAVLPTGPNVRMLLTTAEGLYRIIARKSAGITRLADLKGKRITTPRNTSAHYHLVKMLATAGVAESDVTIVSVPATEMAAAIADRKADAISMWEPEAQTALDLLGNDGIVFQNNGVYRELFSLYTSTEVLGDRKRRAELVQFVRGVLRATETVRAMPQSVMPLVARSINQPEAKVSASWKFHAFPAALPRDMLDVLTEEERWMAKSQQREPRTREQLAAFIDTSVLAEARAK
jgi:sulfonate transport system substrate-binding protein